MSLARAVSLTTLLAASLAVAYIALVIASGSCAVAADTWNRLSPVLVIGSWITTAFAVSLGLVARLSSSAAALEPSTKVWWIGAMVLGSLWLLLLLLVNLTGASPGPGEFAGTLPLLGAC